MFITIFAENGSASGASGPTATAIQSQVLDGRLRSRAIAPASGIEAIETMTNNHHAIPAVSNPSPPR